MYMNRAEKLKQYKGHCCMLIEIYSAERLEFYMYKAYGAALDLRMTSGQLAEKSMCGL